MSASTLATLLRPASTPATSAMPAMPYRLRKSSTTSLAFDETMTR
jgi:hypothetical protein